ncbi:hypothetical protein NHX12_008920, partial [Muraenolepis orangiensis]
MADTRRYYGCGLVVPECLESCRVLDLGSGSGRDCYMLSQLVGEKGQVTGIDMTESLLEVAKTYIDYHTKAYGYKTPNISFVHGYIEALTEAGMEDNSYDALISNGAVNLCPDKKKVLQEAYRVLKEGGECISGALWWEDLLRLAEEVGFSPPRLVTVTAITVYNQEMKDILGDFKFLSATYRLFKVPRGVSRPCQAVYNGGVTGMEDSFTFDSQYTFKVGEVVEVDGEVAGILTRSRFSDKFTMQPSGGSPGPCAVGLKNIELEADFFFDYGTEEITDDQDPGELLAALKQKEEEVILAAQLGNALLLENRQLKDRSETLQEQYADKFEVLEQDRHELRLKLTSCQSQWESQVSDLERDARELSAQAMEMERAMSSELQALKEQLNQAGSHSSNQDDELISAMREQVARLTQREQAIEERLAGVCQENTELRDSLASLHTQLAAQDQRNQQQSQQLSEAHREVEEVRSHSQQLQAQVEELQEEVSFQEARSHRDSSLLSELESSLGTAELGLGKEQNAELHRQNAELKRELEHRQEQTEVVQQAIKDRDEAIAKKNLMEVELVRSKNDMMSLNNQLLEAIQRKLALSQELEAWQDDIQIIINQQLKAQQQTEQLQRKPPHSNGMSFFKKPSTAPASSPWASQPVSPASWSSEAEQEKTQSPWKQWL